MQTGGTIRTPLQCGTNPSLTHAIQMMTTRGSGNEMWGEVMRNEVDEGRSGVKNVWGGLRKEVRWSSLKGGVAICNSACGRICSQSYLIHHEAN